MCGARDALPQPGTGELRLLEVSSGPVRDDEGTIQAPVTVLVDVEDQRRADAEARRLAAWSSRARTSSDWRPSTEASTSSTRPAGG